MTLNSSRQRLQGGRPFSRRRLDGRLLKDRHRLFYVSSRQRRPQMLMKGKAAAATTAAC